MFVSVYINVRARSARVVLINSHVYNNSDLSPQDFLSLNTTNKRHE
jgi:hypothetical protein